MGLYLYLYLYTFFSPVEDFILLHDGSGPHLFINLLFSAIPTISIT